MALTSRTRRFAWIAFLALGLAAAGVYELTPSSDYASGMSAIVDLASLAAIGFGLRLFAPANRPPWLLAALWSALWAAGNGIQQGCILAGVAVPTGSVIDGCYILGNLSLVAMLLQLLQRHEGDRAAWLDAGIVAAALSQIAWVGLISDYALNDTLSVTARVTQITYAITDVLLVALLARVLVSPGKRRPALVLLVGAGVALLVADFAFNWLTLTGAASAQWSFGAGWLFASVLAGSAALHPSMRELGCKSSSRDFEPGRAYLALLFLGAVSAPAIWAFYAWGELAWAALFAGVAGAALTVLVLTRMVGFVRVARQSIALALQNERLLELDRLKDDFVASISHDLRTPLTSIRGYLELVLLEEVGPLNDEQREFLAIVNRNGDRLLQLVDDLLFVARVDAGRFTLKLAETDIGRLVEETVESAVPLAESRGIRLVVNPAGSRRAMVDAARIGRLLDNLLSNALKFTPRGGTVRVLVDAAQDSLVVEVADDGPGIPPEELSRLFDRFYRTEASHRRAVPGTGLGLSIAKAIAEAHGGDIAVDSTPGEGTAFQVRLPLAAPGEVELNSAALAA